MLTQLCQRNSFRVLSFAGIILLVTYYVFHVYKDSSDLVPELNNNKHITKLHNNGHNLVLKGGVDLEPIHHAADAKSELSEEAHFKYNLLNDVFMGDENGKFAASKQLNSLYVPSNIHYFWCGARTFEFREYLSIMSVLRRMRPDRVIFHYAIYPTADKRYYNQWLDELTRDFPFLLFQIMTKYVSDAMCFAKRQEKLRVIMEVINEEGGFYVSDTTWFLDFDPADRFLDFEFAIEEDSLDGFLLLRKGVYKENMTIEDIFGNEQLQTKRVSCSQPRHIYNGDKASPCLILTEKKYDVDFYPKHIWDLNDTFGEIARGIFYGTPEIRYPKPTPGELVPNIGHMVWLKGGEMDMLFYLGALSFLYVMNVETLYIHGNLPPKGPYWEKLKQNERVKHVPRPLITSVYQGGISSSVIMSDVMRVDIMNRYGGIYADIDAVWVRPLTEEERSYDAVACYDWVDWGYPYPEIVNLGVFYGKKNAPFWQVFRESNRVLQNNNPGFTGVQMPYKLLEKYPNLLKMDPRLAVICYQQKCHPIWVDDFHNMKKDHTNTNSIPNWREDVHAFHWTHPNPVEFANISTLINSKGMFAEIGQFILKKAGLLTET